MLALTKEISKPYLGTDLDAESKRVDAPIFAGSSASTLATGRMRAECLWLHLE